MSKADLEKLKAIHTRLLLFQFKLQNINTSNIETDMINVSTALNKLSKIQITKMLSRHEYYNTFLSILMELDVIIKSKPPVNNKAVLLNLRNQIFKSKLKDGIFESIESRRKTTIIFTEFIKGITYFSHEVQYNDTSFDAIYHRNGSCSKNGQGNFDCVNINNRAQRVSNSHLIEKCYIERLLYDDLWLKINQSQQNKGHSDWILETQKAYQSCVPNGHISISVMPYDEYPECLTIEKFRNGELIETQIYMKRWNVNTKEYVFPVSCFKIKANGIVYEKQCNFLQKSAWSKSNLQNVKDAETELFDPQSAFLQ